jgi:Flp pilus assembly protein TadB
MPPTQPAPKAPAKAQELVRPAVERTRRVTISGDHVEPRQLYRLPFFSFGCCWMIAALTGAALAASCFMWLIFACAVALTTMFVMEGAIHVLHIWDCRNAGRQRQRPSEDGD